MKRTKKEEQKIPGVVHLPRRFQTVGRWGGGVCLIMGTATVWLVPVLAAVFFLCALGLGGLALAYRNWCILYNEEGFEAINALGASRKYTYDKINGAGGKWLYLKARRLCICLCAVGRMEFFNTANRAYRKSHENRPIPHVPKGKSRLDIFQGNVQKPRQYVAFYLSIALLIIFVMGFLVVLTKPATPENTEFFRLTFTEYSTRRGFANGMWFQSEADDRPFFHPGWSKTMKAVSHLCNGEEEFLVYSWHRTRNKSRTRPSLNEICSLTGADGTEYLTFEQYNEHQRQQLGQYTMFLSILLLLWLIFVGTAIYIGRHPEKFKEKTVYRFFAKRTIFWKGCMKDGTN